jgi:hypothetical protein
MKIRTKDVHTINLEAKTESKAKDNWENPSEIISCKERMRIPVGLMFNLK